MKKPNDCCNKEENLKPYHGVEVATDRGVTAVKCEVCGCRHFTAIADPLHMRMVTT